MAAQVGRGQTLATVEPAAKSAPQPVELVAEPEPAPEPVVETAITPEPVVEAVAESAPAATEPEAKPVEVEPLVADDLTVMTGIGPKLSAALAERGVTRFAQIAAWSAADLATIDAALSLKGRAVREAWVAQAKRLAKGA